MSMFIGVDLGWYGKPSGLASVALDGDGLTLGNVTRLEDTDLILRWIQVEAGSGNAVVAVDAPLVIRNDTGIRPAERELNGDFRRFHAGCHAANLGRPFAQNVVAFSRSLSERGFLEDADMTPRKPGRFQIEVHPHAATVNLFGLDRIVKYKKGVRGKRANELRRLRKLMLTHLPILTPALSLRLPAVPKSGNLKPVEDQIDAVLCAFIAAHWWFWAKERNRVYGTAGTGSIVVPNRGAAPRAAAGPGPASSPGQEPCEPFVRPTPTSVAAHKTRHSV
jgi:predicted RNase H-like nuclease